MRPVDRARERWQELWQGLRVPAPAEETFRELVAAYGEGHRHYHDLAHVLDCLEIFDRFAHLAERPGEVKAALWLHDAVYDTHRSDNEEASARWAARLLDTAGAEGETVERVRRMILATRHADPPATTDEALTLDVDLSILGRAPSAFERYEAQIRLEYEWVPDAAFRRARAAVLTRFLERDAIYRTPELHATYEGSARANLAAAVRGLCSPEDPPIR